jgi:hypothetical protein
MQSGVQTKIQLTSANGNGNGCQQNKTEEMPPAAKVESEMNTRKSDAEDESHSEDADIAEVEPAVPMVSNSTVLDSEDKKYGDNYKYENDFVEQPGDRQTIEAVEAPSDEPDGGKGLMLSWDEQRKLIASRGRKPQQEIGGSVSLKDRMRALNASITSMRPAATDSPHALNSSSSSLGAPPDNRVEEHDDIQSGVQTKIQVTSVNGNGTNTGCQQDSAQDIPPAAKIEIEMNTRKRDAEDESRSKDAVITQVEPAVQMVSNSTVLDSEDKKYGDNYKYENDFVEQPGDRQTIEAAEVPSDEPDGGKGLMLSWDEQRKLIASRGRKPQQEIGGSVSLKDRMRALNASISSMGSHASDSPHALNSSSSSLGAAPFRN